MANTSTSTQTSTYTQARAKYIIDKIFDDFTALVVRGFATQAKIESWKNDLSYMLEQETLEYFEIQLIKPNGEMPALRYYVKADNSLNTDSASGNLGLYALPAETKARLFAHMNETSPNYRKVHDELHTNRGWGTGKHAEGDTEKHHSYSKEGYGVERNKIGNF